MTNQPAAIVSFLADGKVYLMLGKDNAVSGFESTGKALAYFEEAYGRKHSSGYEASISATINFMTYQPAVHEWTNDDLSPLIEMGVINLETLRAYSLSHVSGFMKGALCTGEKALEFHNSGVTPQLIY